MEQLDSLLIAYVHAAHFQLVETFLQKPSFRPEPIIKHGENGSITTSYVARPDYAETMFESREKLFSLPEVTPLFSLICSDDILRANFLVDAVGDPLPEDDPSYFFNFFVWPFLASYVGGLDSLENTANDRVLARCLADLRSYIKSEQLAYIYETPLVGFKSDLDEIVFSDYIQIRRRNDEDLKRLARQNPYASVPTHDDISFNSHILVVRSYAAKRASMGSDNHLKLAQALLSALRLNKKDIVNTGSGRLFPELKAGPMQWISHTPSSPKGGDYFLKENEVDSVKGLLQACLTVKDTRWQLGLRRLNLTYERNLTEDKLLDCWVALESLLLPDGKNGELKFRVGLRLARFLGDTKIERLELLRTVRESYDNRSAVIHGAATLGAGLPGVTEKTIDLLRRILVRWLDPDHSNDTASIDESLLN